MIFKNINSEDISGLIICSEPPISSSAIRTKETTIDGRDGAIVEKLGYKTRIRNVEIGLKKDANVDKILSYFSGEGDLIFKNENDKVYKAAIYEQVDLERLLRLRKGSVAFYCQPFKYKRNDIFETIKDNKVKEKKGKHLELLNCAEQNVVDLKLEGSTNQATRSGKNLAGPIQGSATYNDITVSSIENGISITGTSTGPNVFSLIGDSIIRTSNYYQAQTIQANNSTKLSLGTYILSYNTSGGDLLAFYGNIGDRLDASTPIPKGTPFTITEDEYVWLGLYVGDGVITNYDITDIQLESGSTTTEYEPYGVMPSPDYPAKIENVEGKNKFSGWVKGKGLDLTTGAEINSNTAATSDYIPVNFNNRAYTISGLTNTLFSYIAIYNSQKQFLGRTGASNYSNLTAYSNSFTSGTSQGTRDIAYVRVTTYENSGVTGKIDDIDNLETQLEEGTVATPYVPYNSLEIKDIGENLFNISKVQNVNDDVANCTLIEKNANGVKIQGATSTSTDIFAWSKGWYCPSYSEASKEAQVSIKEPCTIKLSADVTLLETVTEPRIRMNLRKVNGDAILADSTVLNLNKKTRIEKTFKVTSGKFSPFFALCSNTFLIENIMISTTGGEYKPYQEQKVTFPLSEGQKLYEGSYLASDGIHHIRKQVVFDGSDDEEWRDFRNDTLNRYYISLPNSVTNVGLSSHFALGVHADRNNEGNDLKFFIGGDVINFRNDSITSINNWKTWLFENPITVEYELAEPETVPYTEEQQEAYNQLQKLKLYKGQNTMFSLEGSIINLKYLEDTDEKVENQGNIYSKPIIRLEKTVFKEVEIAINGIRFKYNFEEDDYVEIDCEEMTVQYEGLDRNRRLVIDFEFPKLKEGNNDIVMYSGDCIIKCKRKDRWL